MNDKKKIDFVPITDDFLKSVEKDYIQSGVINPDLHKNPVVTTINHEFNIQENQRLEEKILKDIEKIREKNTKNDSTNETSKKPK